MSGHLDGMTWGDLGTMTGNTDNDWKDDGENANYVNECAVPGCGVQFIGHKDRIVCRKCSEEAAARYAAMTQDEKEEYDARRLRETVKAFQEFKL